MTTTIICTTTIQVVNGLKIAETTTLDAEAYGLIEVTVPAKSSDTKGTVTVGVQPSDLEAVKLVLIHLEQGDYDAYTGSLTYKVNGKGQSIKLDGPQLFIGEGAVSLLGVASACDDAITSETNLPAPNSLTFTNGHTAAAAVQILVGRNATASS